MKKMNTKKLLILLSLFTSSHALADEASGFAATLGHFSAGVDAFFNTYFGWFVNTIFFSVPMGGTKFPLIVGWLFIAAFIFTFYFGFVQFRKFKLSIDIVSGKFSDPNAKTDGEVTLSGVNNRPFRHGWFG